MGIRQSIKTLGRVPLLTTNLWELVELGATNPAGGFGARATAAFTTALSNTLTFLPQAEPPITLLATNVNIPHTSIETEYDAVVHLNKYTGYERPTEVSITFLETQSLTVSKYMKQWLNSYLTKDGTFVHGINPKLNFQVKLQKYKGLIGRIAGTFSGDPLETIAVYTFVGMMFKSRGDFSLAYDSGDNLTVECTFSVDRIEDNIERA